MRRISLPAAQLFVIAIKELLQRGVGGLTSYNPHYKQNTDSEFDGIKYRFTTTITARGGIFPVWVQILGFVEKQIPPDKMKSGALTMKVPHLFTSGGKDSFDFIVLQYKEKEAKTRLFKQYEKEALLPQITRELLHIAQLNDDVDNIPNCLRAVFSNDG